MPPLQSKANHRRFSLDSATSPTSPLSRAGSTSAHFSSPLTQLRLQVEAHPVDDQPVATTSSPAKVETDKKQPGQRRQRSRKLSASAPERNKPLPLVPFEPLVFRTPYRNRSARVRPSPVQAAFVTHPNPSSSPVQSQAASISRHSSGDTSETSKSTDDTLRADRSSVGGASSIGAPSYVTAPPLSRVWSSPDIEWPAAKVASSNASPIEVARPSDSEKAVHSHEAPTTEIVAPTPISPRTQPIPSPLPRDLSPSPLRRGKAMYRRSSPVPLNPEPAQKQATENQASPVSPAQAYKAKEASSTQSSPKQSKSDPTTPSPARKKTSLHVSQPPPTPPPSLPSPTSLNASRRHSDTSASVGKVSALKTERPRSTPLSEALHSRFASYGSSVSAWAVACQTATYLHVLLRSSAFTQHMHDRKVKSPTVLAMLAFLQARPEDPQQLYTLLGRLCNALLEDKVMSSEHEGFTLLERLFRHFARENGFRRLFTTSYSIRTTCGSCATDIYSKHSVGWSAPSVLGDSVSHLAPRSGWCSICGRTTDQIMRSVPVVHAPLLLVEPPQRVSYAAGDTPTEGSEITYVIQGKMFDRAAGKEWTLVGAAIPVSEGQLGFVARVDGEMTLFKGKQRMSIDLSHPVPTPVFVLYEQ